jgi:cytochrome P450
MEVLRISSIIPYGVPHRATEDTELRGYLIPKGVSVYASFYSTHHDPEVWGDPENFRPDRFLSSDGSKVERHESLLPFSTGRRTCPGELLARHQLFLFLTTLVQNFRICNEDGKPLPTLDTVPGNIVLDPYPYSVILKERL